MSTPLAPTITDVLCGVRYRIDEVRSGAGLDTTDGFVKTIVCDGEPVSGPVVRVQHFDNQGDDKLDWWESRFTARCERCKEESKRYKRRNERQLEVWAHRHRCSSTNI